MLIHIYAVSKFFHLNPSDSANMVNGDLIMDLHLPWYGPSRLIETHIQMQQVFLVLFLQEKGRTCQSSSTCRRKHYAFSEEHSHQSGEATYVCLTALP
jgi:hypothetical protein